MIIELFTSAVDFMVDFGFRSDYRTRYPEGRRFSFPIVFLRPIPEVFLRLSDSFKLKKTRRKTEENQKKTKRKPKLGKILKLKTRKPGEREKSLFQ